MSLSHIRSGNSVRFWTTALFVLAASGLLAGCSDDDNGPPDGGEPGVIIVTTVAELDHALTNSVAGDTIEIRSEFISTPYNLTKTYTIPAGRSPLTIVGVARSVFRPEIVFPANVHGIVFQGHDGSSVTALDLKGGQDVLVLDESRVTVRDVHVRDNARYGVHASGTATAGSVVDSCLFENPAVFGVYAVGGATMEITQNTIVNAGDCGLFIDVDATIRNNNIVDAVNQGIHCEPDVTPTLTCNNSFGSGTADYVCPTIPDVLLDNFTLDPEFCPGSYTISEVSGLVAAAELGCGHIGKFWIGCGPE